MSYPKAAINRYDIVRVCDQRWVRNELSVSYQTETDLHPVELADDDMI